MACERLHETVSSVAAERRVSVVIPARNESSTIGVLVAEIRVVLPEAEIIVVDDGSTDDTAAIAEQAGARVLRRLRGMGNGAAIKAGAREANGDRLVFLDADGQHDPAEIPGMLQQLDAGYDMVVGARGAGGQASLGRAFANAFYNRLASWMTHCPIPDLTSGFRVVRADRFLEFLHLLPNGFSYPTTTTMAFLRSAYQVGFVPISVRPRGGASSHIRPLRDGIRFLLIIFKIATLYSPLKLFFPLSMAFFCTGLGYYAYTYLSAGRFTNMSALLFSAAVIIFLIGLISEQITNLSFANRDRK